MELTNNTTSTTRINTPNSADCRNGFTSTNVFLESFGDEDTMSNCTQCQSFKCKGGEYICEKFSN